MGPQEERLGRVVSHHAAGDLGDLAGVPQPVAREIVLVRVESLIEAELPLQHAEADHGSGAPAGVPKGLGQRPVVLPQALPVGPNAMLERQQGGEKAGVARAGAGGVGVGALEQDAAGRQPIEMGRVSRTAVAPEMISPQRVHDDQQQVGDGRRVRRHWPVRAPHEPRHGRHCGDPAASHSPVGPCHRHGSVPSPILGLGALSGGSPAPAADHGRPR